MAEELKGRLVEVGDALVVDVIGMEANATMELRKELRSKNIQLMVVKNSLARRAMEGTALAPAFEGSEGTLAVIWGSEDVVSLAKEVTRLAKEAKYGSFGAKGGVMDGAKLSAGDVAAVSKWPNRQEQLSLLVGQILGPGASLSVQLLAPGGALASQVKQKGEE